ncbi:MAG: SCP2 sterol-binding domain-containing protein [Pseudomonadota bacterium]
MSGDAPLLAAAAAAFQRGFGAVLRIDATDGAPFDVDGRGEPATIHPTGAEPTPDCLWRANSETLLRAFAGGRALESAYLSGRLSIAGDMSVMARLVLEGPR